MQKKKMFMYILTILAVILLGTGCGTKSSSDSNQKPIVAVEVISAEPTVEATEEVTDEPAPETTGGSTEASIDEPTEESTEEPTEEPSETPTEEPIAEPTEVPTAEPIEEPTEEPTTMHQGETKLIVIDAGHQAKGNSEKEPIGPGASEMKVKVTGGATGGSTGQKEYELNLAVSFYLRDELLARGYEVLMVRESHDVNLSNSERAQVANQAGADAFIRIHANGAENTSVHGTETLCQTAENPYNSSVYPLSRNLSERVLEGIVNQTASKNRGVKETDTMSGINWCTVPTTIVEMGFLSNPDEDTLMFTEDYRKKVAVGIANGIDAYFLDNGFSVSKSNNQTGDTYEDKKTEVRIENDAFDGEVIRGRMSVWIDEEPVYTQESELSIIGVEETKWVDLDSDGFDELFVSFSSAVNSMPLEEWFVLKEQNGSWKRLEMYHNDGNIMHNAFPVIVTLHSKDFDLRISCEGLTKEIPFDATNHYEKVKNETEEGNNSFDLFMSPEWHQAGKIIGETLPWGIWNIETGSFEGKNCLVAEHGLCGPGGKYDYYGNAYVCFNYDEKGNIQILDLSFQSEF